MTERVFLEKWLIRFWWPLFPCFAALILRLVAERACGNPYDLLPELTSEPKWAWTLGVVYLVAHLWVLGAYLLTVFRTQALVPHWHAIREMWGIETPKLISMVGVLTLEYSPVPLWRLIGAGLGCAR